MPSKTKTVKKQTPATNSREKLQHVFDFMIAGAPRCDTAGHINKAGALYIGKKSRKVFALCDFCIEKAHKENLLA